MKAEIINIGTELLLGQIINTNAAALGQRMALTGIDVCYQSVVGDNKDRLAKNLRNGLKRSDVVIITGGLGPTEDDITVGAIAKSLDTKLILNKRVLAGIEARFKKSNIRMPASNIRQAYIPQKAKIIENHQGTAPGLIIKVKANKYLIALPGVPREMEAMMDKVIPFLKKIKPQKSIIKSRSIKITGLSESAVNDKVADLLKMGPEVTLGIYASPSEIALRITAKAENEKTANKAISKIEKELKIRLKEYIFGTGPQTLESVIGDLLIKQKMTLAVAESCTGGLITNRLTNIPGSSKYLLMGITAYSNKAKIEILKVPSKVIKQHGAVSSLTALAMAKGIQKLSNSHLALGITGIAGPGTSEKKPTGLVYISFVAGTKKSRKIKYTEYCHKYNFSGSREIVKYRTSQAALDIIRRYLGAITK